MSFLVSGVAVRMTRFTTLAGSSSIMSTASSTYSSSSIPESSESVMEFITCSCSGASKFAKTSAAVSFDRSLNTIGMRLSPISERNSATSNSCISSSRCWRRFISRRSRSSVSSSFCRSWMASKSIVACCSSLFSNGLTSCKMIIGARQLFPGARQSSTPR